jgi:hypothetical protein
MAAALCNTEITNKQEPYDRPHNGTSNGPSKARTRFEVFLHSIAPLKNNQSLHQEIKHVERRN